jgi:hypothetical protein
MKLMESDSLTQVKNTLTLIIALEENLRTHSHIIGPLLLSEKLILIGSIKSL